jgi:hypothetical protein
VALLTLCHPASATDLAQWKRLLHYDNGSSEVVSPGFFLHERGGIDPLAELDLTISLLGLAGGQEVACRVPARYTWLKSEGLVTADHDLSRCADLVRYEAGFGRETLSIVFVTEHLDGVHSLSSTFGHILLHFGAPDIPRQEGATVHYAAEPTSDGFPEFAIKGVFGGYEGWFRKSSFASIRELYSENEQRYLVLYELEMPPGRIRQLVQHLYELRKARFDYHFIRENCAYQIARLVEIAYGGGNGQMPPYVLPIKVVEAYGGQVAGTVVIEPPLARDGRRGQSPIFTPPDTFWMNHRSLLSAGVRRTDDESTGALRFRLAGKDLYDLQFDRINETVVELLDVGLYESGDKVKFESVDLVQARSVIERNARSSAAAWSIYLGLDRQDSSGEMGISAAAGLGRSVGGRRGGAAFMVEAGLQQNRDDGMLFLRPRLDLVWYPLDKVKMGASIFKKLASSDQVRQGELFLAGYLGRSYLLGRVVYCGEERERRSELSLNMRF